MKKEIKMYLLFLSSEYYRVNFMPHILPKPKKWTKRIANIDDVIRR